MKTLKKIIITLAILLCFAPAVPADQFTDASYYIWRLINETRQRPLQSVARLGIGEAQVREALGASQWILDQGLPPLALIPQLESSATAHSQDMFQNVYYAFNSLDGRTVSDRIVAAGYTAQTTGETLGALAFRVFMDPMEAAVRIFSNLITDELTPGNTGLKNILSPDFTEIGISYSGSLLNLGQGLPLNVYLLVVDFARPVQPRSFFIGNVFRDLDGDGFMLPSDAVPGATKVARIHSQSTQVVVPDSVLSSYQVELSVMGFYMLEAWGAEGQMLAQRGVYGNSVNQFQDFGLE